MRPAAMRLLRNVIPLLFMPFPAGPAFAAGGGEMLTSAPTKHVAPKGTALFLSKSRAK